MAERKKEFIRTAKFTLFSASAGIIQIGTYTVFSEAFKWEPWFAHLISLILSVVWNFTLNRKFTFYSANNVPIAMLKVSLFYVIFTPISTLWTLWFTKYLFVNKFIVEAGTMIINFVTEYLYDRFIVFGKSIDTAKNQTEKE